MTGNIGNLGATNLLKNKNDAVRSQYKHAGGWMKHAKGMLKALVLGLMLVCGTAYASEQASPVPVSMTKNKVDQTNSTQNNPASTTVGDSIFDWSIAFFIIVLGVFFSIQFLDSKKEDKK